MIVIARVDCFAGAFVHDVRGVTVGAEEIVLNCTEHAVDARSPHFCFTGAGGQVVHYACAVDVDAEIV